jgi:PAS domain S-box-containing protein
MERKTEEVTRDDAQLLYDAFTASPIGIALENIEGQPFFVNPALCSMLGFSEEEMRTRHCVDFSPKEDAERDWTLFQQLRSGTIDHYQLEKRFFRRNGSLMWGRLSISLLNHTSPIVIAMVEDITDKKIAQEHAEALVTDMSRKLIEAQERERTLIARELHDDISQQLGLLAIELEQLQQQPEGFSELQSQIRELRTRVTEISERVQGLSHELHSSKLEYLGLVAAAKSWCREFAELRKLKIEFTTRGVPNFVAPEISLCLFRVLQEALHNAAKHSGAKKIDVQLVEENGQVHLTVTDQGRGFDVEAAMLGQGLGLTSMRERVRLLDGTMTIDSRPRSGTTIHVRLPLIQLKGSHLAAG